jgi:ssDNA-binding Zn-finger/Zn-ribbon topoisomerase 1
MNKKEGKEIICRECNRTFIFTEGEQAFYKEKGFESEPKRCPNCRLIAKIADKVTMNILKKYGIVQYIDSVAVESGTEEA